MKRFIRTIFVMGIILCICTPLFSQQSSDGSGEQESLRKRMVEAIENLRQSEEYRAIMTERKRLQKLTPLDDHSVSIDAATLIERHIEALGGREAMEAIQDRTVRSDISLIRMNAANSSDTLRGRKLRVTAYPDKQTDIELRVLTRKAPRGYKADGEHFFQEWSGDRPTGETCEFKKPVDEDCPPSTQHYMHEIGLFCIYDRAFGSQKTRIVNDQRTLDIDSEIDEVLKDPRQRLPGLYSSARFSNWVEEESMLSDEDKLYFAPFNEVIRQEELGYKIRLLGKEIFDVNMAYQLEVSYGEASEIWIIDCKTYMKLAECSLPKYGTPGITRYYDYLEVDGVMLPHSSYHSYGTGLTTIDSVESYQHNTNPPEKVFGTDD